MSVVELLVTSHYRSDSRCSRVVTVRDVRREQELFSQWMQERPLYQATSEHWCDWTFVRTVGEMKYIPRTNVELLEGESLSRRHSFFRSLECVQYPPAWRENHCA